MMEENDIEYNNLFIEKISVIHGQLPLNYNKARLVFSNRRHIETSTLIKFITIKKYGTTQAQVKALYKPISRMIQFNNIDSNENI